MDVAIVAVGRLKAGPENELCSRYLERARLGGRALGLRGFDVVEIGEARGARASERIAGEEAALLGHLAKGGRTVCLDSDGDLLDSAAFAARLSRDAAASVPRTTFVIGGPDGIGEGVLAMAETRISFGRVTWPHQIVRILLAEQIYRATTILSGHPYHRV
jgi:23S rRNA (pseudouridine1915-N3)-methyltransferase